jgi:hypothetical protein
MLLKILAVAMLVLVSGALGLGVAWQLGYISRVVAIATSPDARVEAVCRGRLPEQTEYDLWLRQRGALFGRRLGHVGTESMGRCRRVVWSPGGEVVATLSEGGQLAVFDGRTGSPRGTQWLVHPGGSYPMERIVTKVNFHSADVVAFAHCARLWHTTRRPEDAWRCGSGTVEDRVALDLKPPRGFIGR